MSSIIEIATYVSQRYLKEFGKAIDEMKLHKLLYFMQRECIAETGKPMFDATFYAWKYGPVLHEVRSLYKSQGLNVLPKDDLTQSDKKVIDTVFADYAQSKSITLSFISHGELSWKRARKGYGKYDESDVPMAQSDIIEDAKNYKRRCEQLKALGMLNDSKSA